MGWLKTFSLVIRSNMTSLSESFENPERVLHQLVLDMEEELERVRGTVASVIADEIQLGRKVEKARADVEQWQQRATGALQRGDETNARAALEQKLLADERATSLGKEYARQKEESGKLRRAIADLEHKILQARHKRSLLSARMARVESAKSINSVLKRTEDTSALATFHRLEQRVERAEALEEAQARLDGHGADEHELARQFAEQEQRARLQKEFEELKRRVQDPA